MQDTIFSVMQGRVDCYLNTSNSIHRRWWRRGLKSSQWPLVVVLTIANCVVRKILVDIGNSANILYLAVYDQTKLGRDKLQTINSLLVGFSWEWVYHMGSITLPFTIGDPSQQVTAMSVFFVIDSPSAYNTIVGQMTLNSIKAVTSVGRRLLTFSTLCVSGLLCNLDIRVWVGYVWPPLKAFFSFSPFWVANHPQNHFLMAERVVGLLEAPLWEGWTPNHIRGDPVTLFCFCIFSAYAV